MRINFLTNTLILVDYLWPKIHKRQSDAAGSDLALSGVRAANLQSRTTGGAGEDAPIMTSFTAQDVYLPKSKYKSLRKQIGGLKWILISAK